MVHEANFHKATNKAILDQSDALWLVGSKGNQGSMTFLRTLSFLGNQEQVFLFSLLISKLICALLKCAFQHNTRYKVSDFFHNH